jgi:hypothetical protein
MLRRISSRISAKIGILVASSLEPNNIILFTESSIPDKDTEAIGVKKILQKPLSLEELEATINRFRH